MRSKKMKDQHEELTRLLKEMMDRLTKDREER